MDSVAANLTVEPEIGVYEIWEAVRDRSAGERRRTRSACIRELSGRRGASWIKERYAVFAAFREHGITEIAPAAGYSPSQSDRNRGVFAPSEVLRWLKTYSRRISEEELRSLLTWHLRWLHEPGLQTPVHPPSSPHLAGLLKARTRVTASLDLSEPMRIVERSIWNQGAIPSVVDAPEREGPDPAIAQLRAHVPDDDLWGELGRQREAIDAYATTLASLVDGVQAEALTRTGMQRGYGYGGSSIDPSAPPTLLEGYLFALFDHAFALLDGQAPSGLRSRVVAHSPEHPLAFKLETGWASLYTAALGDEATVEQSRSVLYELDDRLLHSPEVRRTWDAYERVRDAKRSLIHRFATLDEPQISRGHCWGCSS